MLTFEKYLDDIAARLGAGESVAPVVIRKFMHMAGAERRTKWNVDYIDRNLSSRNLTTRPDYRETWVDEPTNFVLISEETPLDSDEADIKNEETADVSFEDVILEDPSFKVKKLKAAQTAPLFVHPNAPLEEVTTKMLANNYSQLPVGQNLYKISGIISWSSIARRLLNGASGSAASQFEDPYYEILSSASIFSAVQIVAEHDYALVRSDENRAICGIVTASDLCEEFEEISKPFLLLSEIEIHIRNIIENKIPLNSIDANGEAENPSAGRKKTFGDYVQIMANPVNWDKLGLHLDRKTLCADLDSIRLIRNNVMHFATERLQPEQIEKLRSVARMFDFLHSLKVRTRS